MADMIDFLQQLQDIQNLNVTITDIFEQDEERFLFNSKTRTITIPDEFKTIGVINDSYAQTVTFEVDNLYDGSPLYGKVCIIQYVNEKAPSEQGIYHVTNKTITAEGKLLFSWTIDDKVTRYKGTVQFAVRFYTLNADGSFSYNMNSKIAFFNVDDGLDVTNGISQKYSDTLNQLMAEIDALIANGGLVTPTILVEGVPGGVKITGQDKNGTTTATILNGTDGINGISPTATVTKANGVATITITDVNGTTTTTVSDSTGSSGSNIDDTVPSLVTTYSSTKIEEKFNQSDNGLSNKINVTEIYDIAYSNTYDGYYDTSTKTIKAHANYRSLNYIIPDGTTLKRVKISGRCGQGSSIPLVCFLDNNNIILSQIFYTANTVYENLLFDVPINTKTIYVNGSNQYISPKIEIPKIQNNISSVDFYSKTMSGKYKILNPNTVYPNSYFNNLTGTTQTNSTGVCCQYNIDSSIKKLRVTGRTSGGLNFSAICFVDGNNYCLFRYGESLNTVYSDVVIDVPVNSTKLYVNGNNMCSPFVEILIENEINYSDDCNSKFINTLIQKQKVKNDFAWKTMDTGYFAFVYDDGNANFNLIEDLFESKNLPCCFGIMPLKIYSITGNSETFLSVAKRCVDNGGEILLHTGDVITASNINNPEFLYRKFVKERDKWEQNGINIRGAIRDGGSGELNNSPITHKWCKLLFDYSDLYGVYEPYNHPRTTCVDNITTMKAIVDDAIANRKFIAFLNHDIKGLSSTTNGEMSLSVTEELIDYIIQQGGKISNYSYVYDTFGTTIENKKVIELESRLIALESKL